MNKAVPGLFPELQYQSSSALPDVTDDSRSIDSELVRKVFHRLPSNYAAEIRNDRFYLSKLYASANQKVPEVLNFSNFEQFNQTCDREMKLRNKLDDYIANTLNDGVILPQIDDLDVILTTVPDKNIKSSSNWRSKIFDILNIRRNEDFDEQFTLSLGRINSATDTTIIDETGPELDFIDYKYDKQMKVLHIKEVPTDWDEDVPIEERQRKRYKPALTLQRKLKIRHLQMISLGATIGVGLFLNSGKAFSIAGPMGAFIGFFFGGLVILATLFSFAEMVALIPLTSGISGLCSRFVGHSFGFTVGWCHWVSYAAAFPSELIASAMILSYYRPFEGIATSNNFMALTITILVIVTTAINLFDVRVYGELEYMVSVFKLIIVIFLVILVVVLNCGGFHNNYIGFKYWTSSRSPSPDITFGPFRPTFDLGDNGSGSKNGIGGFGGVVLSCIAACVTSVFSYIGSEIGFIAASEAENPRKAVPSVTKRIFFRVVIFYLLSIFTVGTVIYSGDPRLLRIIPMKSTSIENNLSMYKDTINELGGMNCNSVFSTGNFFSESSNQSPWVIAFKSIKQCTLANLINGFFVFIGLSTASSQLYASSRTLYAMASQNKAPGIFTRCTNYGVPYAAVIFCGSLGFLSLLCLNLKSTEALLLFMNFGITGAIIMWFGMNLSFYRFYLALKRRPDIIDRNSKEYPYKSPFQPYLSIFGMVSTTLLLLLNGFQNFFRWNTLNFISSYCNILVFIVLYSSYNWIRGSNINHVELIDLDSGRREMDRVIWNEEADYSLNLREFLHKVFSYV